MHHTENVELTVLCLLQDGERILLQNRTKKDWKGYTLPGGHVEPGESFVDAVIREMKEETGLTVWNPKLAGITTVGSAPMNSRELVRKVPFDDLHLSYAGLHTVDEDMAMEIIV